MPTLWFNSIPFDSLIEKLTSTKQIENKMIEELDPFSSEIPTLLKTKGKGKEYDALVKDFAKDLTGVTRGAFDKIAPGEFTKQAWVKNKENAPNIVEITKRFNATSNYVIKTIIEQSDVKNRALIQGFYIDVATQLMEKNNYNDAMAIIGAFGNSSVNRLKKTMEIIPMKQKKGLEQLKIKLNNHKNFKELRGLIQGNIEEGSTFIPYIGIFLQDLTFADENTSKKGEGFNIDKLDMMGKIIKKVLGGKSGDPIPDPKFDLLGELNKVAEIKDFENIMYTKSLELEPRE